MFTYKSKPCKESPIPEPAIHQLSPRPLVSMTKKGKQSKIQHFHKQIQSNKLKHKINSKSNLQNYEQKHHNSPIWPNIQTQNKIVSPFSFTTLLKKNIKNQALSISNNSVTDQLIISNNQKNDCENKKKGDFNKKINGCSTYFTPNTISTSLQKKSVLQQMSCSLNTVNPHKQIMSYQKSIGRESKKSPIRMVNANKLNNTPKLKQRKEVKQKQINQSKTFKSVLDSNIIKSFRESSSSKINLECSEKIQKFIHESHHCNQSKNNNNNCSPSKSKSNLLSTGFINMSQPVDSNDAIMSYRATQISRDSLNCQNIPNKTSSQQFINQFQEDEQHEEQILQVKLKGLKLKIGQLQLYYSDKMQNLHAQQFAEHIRQQYNPELNYSQIKKQIDGLNSFKEQILSNISSLLEIISKFSTKIVSHINESIQVLEDSCKSSINWMQIQGELAAKDWMELCMGKNQLILQKLDFKSGQIFKCFQKGQNVNDQKYQIEKEISKIQKQVQVQSAVIASDKPKITASTSLSEIAIQQFQVISLKLSQLKSKLIKNMFCKDS